MTIFAVVALDQAIAQIDGVVEAEYPESYVKIAKGHYLVKDSNTSQAVSDKLHVTGGDNGRVIVYAISGYFGYGPINAWEWLKANWSAGT